MAVSFPAVTWTMSDAEFLTLNGNAAPTINPGGVFGSIDEGKNATGLSASSASGTTTVTLAAGLRNRRFAHVIDRRLRRLRDELQGTGSVTFNM